ncbi:hypothetical protein QBC43DRAFT_345475 [Cladorrhinum sp. PSN259]|nr:hypothetical protein QBC43DRAFT_345475 [Cladorrhinum sp. PSN259]
MKENSLWLSKGSPSLGGPSPFRKLLLPAPLIRKIKSSFYKRLFEEGFVSFESIAPSSAHLTITSSPIVISQEDFLGVHIAASSLAEDLAQITGFLRNITTGAPLSVTSQWGKCTVYIEGKWETFKSSIVEKPLPGVDRALMIAGSDKRGTIFGIHTLAEQCGQSPYHFHGEPTVKYRGLFISDKEPALNTWWARQHNATRYPLNTEFYTHVFDLLLRLRENYLWPAMWKSVTLLSGNVLFTDDFGYQQLADDYGIYISIGLRGLGDEAATSNIKTAIEMISDVFETQRAITKKYHDSETALNQVWALYKEVASYYDAGLDPLEGVALLFPDDNAGNLYRLPTGAEAGRKGGTGVYFHWEYVGLPRSYKIWIINVGNIKPMELPFEFAMDLAWNVSKFSFEGIPEYLAEYATREFGPDHATEIVDILLEHSHLVRMRRYGLVTSSTFSHLNYHEADRSVANYWAKDKKTHKSQVN